jgi:outer membrane cobalamin receptor
MSLTFLKIAKILPVILLIISPLLADDFDGMFIDEFDEQGFQLVMEASEGITVTGTQKTSQQMAVIDRKEIERRGAADIASLLQEALDLNIVRYGTYGNQTGINLRGFDSKRVAFLIDGIPVNSPFDGKFDINSIDLNTIESIEVIYGGSDSKFNVSGALGGVINIITVKKQNQGLRLGFSVSNTSAMPGRYVNRNGENQSPNFEDLTDTQNYSMSTAYGGGGFFVTANFFANRAQNHFLFNDFTQQIRRKDNNEVRDAGAAASVVWDLPDFSKLIVASNLYYGIMNFPSSGFSYLFGTQKELSTRQNLMLDMPRVFRDDLATEVSVAWQLSKRDYTSPTETFSHHDLQNLTAINRWSWYPQDNITLRTGVDYRFIYLDSTDIGNRNRQDGGIYLTAEYKPVKQFMVNPSVKTVFTSEGDTPFTAVPKLGILWNVTESFALKNNWFRSFKFPDFEELYWSGGGGIGNPSLRPEDGWGVDLGIEWRITEQVKLESSSFAQWTIDSIHWFNGYGGIWRPENVGKAAFFGLDSRLKFEIPVSVFFIKKIITSVSYKYLLSYLLSYGFEFKSNKRIPYSPEHTIGSSIDFLWDSGSLVVSGHYESSRFNDTQNLIELKPYFFLNANVNQQMGNNFSLFGALRNILNKSYESFYDYPMPGITLTIGLRANFKMKGAE